MRKDENKWKKSPGMSDLFLKSICYFIHISNVDIGTPEYVLDVAGSFINSETRHLSLIGYLIQDLMTENWQMC